MVGGDHHQGIRMFTHELLNHFNGIGEFIHFTHGCSYVVIVTRPVDEASFD